MSKSKRIVANNNLIYKVKNIKKPLIFIFNQFAIFPDMPGGTRHYDFGKELAKRGNDVYIFASDYSHQKLEYLKLKNNENHINKAKPLTFKHLQIRNQNRC